MTIKCSRRQIPLLFFLLLAAAFHGCRSDFKQTWNITQDATPPRPQPAAGCTILRVSGNVYPIGNYYVNVRVGPQSKTFDLDIDTGSDLTWLQCDFPCHSCSKPPDQQYKPHNNIVPCNDPLCSVVPAPPKPTPCKPPNAQCRYEISYADHGSSAGVLVKDQFAFQSISSKPLNVPLAFGCGSEQRFAHPTPPRSTSGVLGLGNGKVGIISQLSGQGVIRNVLGHCLSTKGDGYLFLGECPLPATANVAWVPMNLRGHYSSGSPAELLYNGKPVGVKGLQLIFDSGSSYTYFTAQAYQAILSQLRGDLMGKPLKEAPEDKSLPVCWKGQKPFRSVNEVKALFKPFELSFANNAKYQIQPEAYLIVTNHGNACLGILNGSQDEVGLKDVNVIGDISLVGKMVIYDNEKRRMGWAPAGCVPPKSGNPTSSLAELLLLE